MAKLPPPYPEGTTIETTWLDARGEPTTQDQAVSGETVATLPDGSTDWVGFVIEPERRQTQD